MTDKIEEAWAYLTTHRDDIRNCVKMFSSNSMQSMSGSFGKPLPGLPELFDIAFEAKDSKAMCGVLDQTWLRAPERREVYQIPGFTELCNLMDGTVDGLLPEEDIDEDDIGKSESGLDSDYDEKGGPF